MTLVKAAAGLRDMGRNDREEIKVTSESGNALQTVLLSKNVPVV